MACSKLENFWRIINTIASIWLWKYARIFILGHYLLLEGHSFARASLSENCSKNEPAAVRWTVIGPAGGQKNGSNCLENFTRTIESPIGDDNVPDLKAENSCASLMIDGRRFHVRSHDDASGRSSKEESLTSSLKDYGKQTLSLRGLCNKLISTFKLPWPCDMTLPSCPTTWRRLFKENCFLRGVSWRKKNCWRCIGQQ